MSRARPFEGWLRGRKRARRPVVLSTPSPAPALESLESRVLLSAGAPPGAVVISEIMYHPSSLNSAEEFIELHNRTASPVNVAGWRLANGVEFTLPAVSIPAGGFLVVAADLPAFSAKYPGVTNVVGGWYFSGGGELSNRGELIELEDNLGTLVDAVEYADEGAWAVRQRGPTDAGHQGWEWFALHDGGGRSLELVNVNLTNDHGGNWASSLAAQGTPGAANGNASGNLAPLVVDVEHLPAIPHSTDPVTVTARLVDELTTGLTATLRWRLDGAATFNTATMFDDGLHGDGLAGDGVFGATIPAQANNAIVEFYVEGRDAGSLLRTWPGPASGSQQANLLYQVDDSFSAATPWVPGSQPIYKLIMTNAERAELAAIGDGPSSEAASNAQMNATFISIDGVDTKVRYLTGVRNRGNGSRVGPPNNYRVGFSSDDRWKDVDSANINYRYGWLQSLGSAIVQLAGIPAADASPVQVRVNNTNLALTTNLMYGTYVHLEPLGSDFADHHFAGDSEGNLYRVRDDDGTGDEGDLKYEGADPVAYQNTYAKATNEDLDDWSDLVHMLDVLNNTPSGAGSGYLDAVGHVIDVRQWLRYIAMDSLLGNLEGGLNRGTGDDFALYRGLDDTRFQLVFHDLDTILGQGDQTPNPDRSIFTYTANPGLAKLLNSPEVVAIYYQELLDLMDSVFNPGVMDPLIDQVVGAYVPEDRRAAMKQFVIDRRAGVLAQIPQAFAISTTLTQVDGYYRTTSPALPLTGTADAVNTQSVLVNGQLATWNPATGAWGIGGGVAGAQTIVPAGASWKYLDNGSNQGTAWRASAFNDSSWASGNAQLGYGDNDEATVVSFGGSSSSKFITTYFRKSFTVADPAAFTALTLRLLRDDGAVVYLNGTEVARSNMPTGTISSSTLASSSVGGSDEGAFFSFNISPGQLLAGNNVLAVEIHQNAGDSSDISFDLELLGQTTVAGGGIALNPGVNRVLVQAFDKPNGNGNELDRGTIDVWCDGAGSASVTPWSGPAAFDSLQATMPASYLPGVAMLIDLAALDEAGEIEKNLWDGIATITSDRDDIILSTHDLRLYNGRGSALVTVSGPGTTKAYGDGSFNLTITLGSHTFTMTVTSLVGVAQTNVAGTLPGASTTWSGVVHVTGDVIVPAGHTLTIQPGTVVLLDGNPALLSTNGVDIEVRGTLNSLGTAANPVTFTATNPAAPWGELRHVNSTASLYQFTHITRAGHSPRGGHTNTGPAVRTSNSAITFDHAAITDSAGKIMQATSGSASSLIFRDSLLSRGVMGPEIEGTALLFEDSHVIDMLGIYREDGLVDDDDGIYIHDQLAGQVVTVRRSVFAHGDDDGIDTLNATMTIDDVIIRDWLNTGEDAKGVSVNGGSVAITRSLIVNNYFGVSSKNNVGGSTAVTTIDRTTIVATNTGVQRVGSGAGIQTTVTNSIVQAPNALDGELNPAAMLVTYTNANEAFTGTGNINGDPLFVDAVAGNYRLSAGSPSVNAGNPAAPLDGDGSRADQGYYGNGSAAAIAPSQTLSGTIAANTVLIPQNGPYTVSANVTIAAGATLFILPGTSVFFASGASLTVNGRLVAEGTEFEQVRFTRAPAAGSNATWNGIQFVNTTQDNRITWAVIEHAHTNSGAVGLSNSSLTIDHATFDKNDRRRIESNNSSLIVRNSRFETIFAPGVAPTSDNFSEHIHGGGVPVGGQVVIENNYFGHITGHNDAVDYDGVINQGRVVVIRNNHFSGGGDDALDLTGDFLIEGNTFSHYRKDSFNTDPGNSNNISASGGTFTIVRNTFFDLEHVAIVKEGASANFLNNTAHDIDLAAIYFDLAGQTSGPGLGATVESSVFHNIGSLFGAITTQTPVVNRSIVPAADVSRGTGNLTEDPRLTDPDVGDMTLRPGSPAIGSGLGGIDRGALVEEGAHISGGPRDLSPVNTATFTITGPGITHYKVKLDNGAYGAETPITTALQLNSLANGTHTIRVIGRNAAGQYQSDADAAVRSWTVNTALSQVVINEVFAVNTGAVNHSGTFPDIIELFNAGASTINLAGRSISDNPLNPAKFVFPAGTTIAPGAFLTLFAADSDGTAGIHLGFSLDGDGEGVYLFDSSGNGSTLLDSVSFGPQVANFSIGRVGPSQSWALTQPTIGSANVAARTGDASLLRLNEWGTNGQVRFDDDFLELYNADTLPVALGGLTVSDNPARVPDRHTIAPLSFAGAQGFIPLVADGKTSNGPNHLDFNLSSDRGFLGLFTADAAPIDRIHYGPQTQDVSHGRLPNGGDTLVYFTTPTPGAANATSAPQVLPLSGFADVWSYNQSNTNLGTAWRAAAFNDAAWPTGPGLLAVETSALPAPIGTNLTLGPTTFYFRRHFTLDRDPSQVTLHLSGIIDDAAVIYLNGQEIYRLGFNAGTSVSFSTLAQREVGNAVLEGAFSVPTTHLVQGDNVLAVEVHQFTAGSGDIVFGLKLDAQVIPPPAASAANLRVSEINYNPLGGADFEFIELVNTSGATIDLSGAAITAGVQFAFAGGAVTTLAAGQRVLVVKNRAAFESRYGTGLPVAGEFGGSLEDAGEEILIVDALNQIIQQFSYSDSGSWPGRADGGGSSLEVIDPVAAIDFNDPDAWRSSSEVHGSPGVAGLGPDNRVVVNEVLSHTDPPLKDALELFNTTGGAINIGGWFLSDSADNLSKFRIPNGTMIAAGGYLVFDEDDINPGLGTLPTDFTFNSAHGDDVYLVQADPATGKLIRFVDVVSFGAQANGESWGRVPNATGALTPLASRSLGSANGNARVGPVLISEVMYHPALPAGGLPAGMTVDDLEYVEVFNPTASAIDLVQWRLRGGVDFDFPITPAALILAPGAALIVAPFNPADPLNATKLATFRSVYGLAASVPIVGGYSGVLNDQGESIRLERPDEPPADEPAFFPRLLEDQVEYDDLAPWPAAPAGGGQSLSRVPTSTAIGGGYGNFVTSWSAAAPTPGTHVGGGPANQPPVAQNNSYTTSEDVPLVRSAPQGVLANDSDPDGGALAVLQVVTPPQHGSLNLAADGSFTFTPASNFSGADSFVYRIGDGQGGTADATVNLTINPVNDPPSPLNDSYGTNEDTPLVVSAAQGVLANDGDVDGDALSVLSVVTQPAHGSLSLSANGSFTYTPAANYNGPDSFVYRVTDGKAVPGTADATVNLTINPANDAPLALDDAYSTGEDATLVVGVAQGVLGNDSDIDGDALSVQVLAAPAHGSLTLNPDGSFTYAPAADYSGPDSFDYRAGDGNGGSADATVNLTITAINDGPVAVNDLFVFAGPTLSVSGPNGVLANDSDPDGDALTVALLTAPSLGSLTLNADGSFTYTPGPNFVASDSFIYTVSDGRGGSATAGATLQRNIVFAPVIAVTGNGATIANGDVTPAPADHTAYGGVNVSDTFGGGTVTRTYTIRNDGNADLTLPIDPISFTGAAAADFTVSSPPALLALGPGQSTTFDVRFNPSAPGVRAATVRIASDDPDDPLYTFAVEGSGEVAGGPSVISIIALDPAATESAAGQTADPATFRILRSGATTGSLTIKLTRKGTAKFGAAGDYTLSVGGVPLTAKSVVIPAGADHVDVTVNTVDNALAEKAETVILGVAKGKGYTLTTNTAQRTATATITDNEALVTIAAIDSAAAESAVDEPANTALVRISRGDSAGLASPLTVKFTLKGAAGFGAAKDYLISVLASGGGGGVNLASTSAGVVIPAGQDHVDLLITPVDNALVEPAETVTVTLSTNTAYVLDTIVANRGATVTIADNESVVSITATDASATEPDANPEDHGRFTITRTGSTAQPLTVKLTKSGTTGAADFIALPTAIVIPAGQSSITLDVIALADTLNEANETVTLTLGSSTAYTQSAARSATVTLANRPAPPPVDLALLAATYAAMTIDRANLAAAAGKTVSVSLRNQSPAGSPLSGPFTLEFFLSADREFDPAGDFLLFTAAGQPGVPAGKTQSRSVKLATLLAGANPLPAPGAYFLIVRLSPASPDAVAANNLWGSAINNITVT